MTSAAIKMRVQLSLQDPVSIPFGYIPTSGIVVSGSGSFSKYAVLCCVCAQSPSRIQLCDTIGYSWPGSSVLGILQARILEWVPFLSPGDLPDPGIEPVSPTLQANSLPSEPPGKPNTHQIPHPKSQKEAKAISF